MNLNIVFVPKDINFIPSTDAVDQVTQYLEDEVGDSVEFVDVGLTTRLYFVDEGDTWLPVIGCPSCNSNISTSGEHSDWVKKLREKLISDRDLDLNSYTITMPCCNRQVAVTSLDFDGKAGFARFSATLEGADIEDQEEEITREIGRIIGCDVSKIELIST